LEGDFDVLQDAIQRSRGIKVTPHCLAEASNFLRQIADPDRTRIGALFQLCIKQFEELYVASAVAAARPEFFRHGLADMTVIEAIQESDILLSLDGQLCNDVQVAGKNAITFARVREDYIDLQKEI
jgi:hypothetical protein